MVAREQEELGRRDRDCRQNRSALKVKDRIVVLVDDGLATGSTMRAAAAALSQRDPERLVIAVPIAAPEACRELKVEVDEIVCAMTPEPFWAVGYWYQNFDETTDEEVQNLLEGARQRADAVGNRVRQR